MGRSFPSQATSDGRGGLEGAKHLADFISHLPEMTEMKIFDFNFQKR